MYIGSTGPRGLHQLVFEVVDNAVDEALGGPQRPGRGHHPSGQLRDGHGRGRGIPVEVMKDQGLPALTVVLTKLHAGGKFGGEGYKVSGGLHGVGVSVVNALSEWLVADVHLDGKIYRQEFARGEPLTELEKVGITQGQRHDHQLPPRRGDVRGGRVLGRGADAAPARDRVPHRGAAHRLHRRARRRRAGRVQVRRRDQGLRLARQLRRRTRSTSTSSTSRATEEQGTVEVAMQWNRLYVESVFSFANNINTTEGGSHLSGFKAALTKTLNDYARAKSLLKEKEDNLEGEDVREGLAAVISVKLREPQFEGQTKTKLGNPWVRGHGGAGRERAAGRVPRGEPDRGEPDRQEGDRSRPRAQGRAPGARPDAPQGRARLGFASRQARRLPDPGPGVRRALPRRGQLRRRLRGRRPRPHVPGHPAAARQGDQLREEPAQQGAVERRDPVDRSPRSARGSATSSTSRSSATTGSSS